MDDVISIELFKQVYKFKTDLDPQVSRDAVDMLQNAVLKTRGESGSVPLTERQIVLMMASLDLASDYIRLKQQYDELLKQLKSRSDSLIAKLNSDI